MPLLNWCIEFILPLLYGVAVAFSSESGYIECTTGALNVILSAPHGGSERPSDIPDRVAGCYIDGECVYNHSCGVVDDSECPVNILNDLHTKDLTELIANFLEESTGKRPYIAINNLHRRKMDANREVNEAACGVDTAIQAHREFHQCLTEARNAIQAYSDMGGRGLFLDIHGHGHPNNWAELGYLIYSSQLANDDITASSTSLHHLSTISSYTIEALVRGNVSFGHYLEQEGYTAVPSPLNLDPNGESYLSGGYNTKVYGSRDGGSIDAIQIESSSDNRADDERDNYSRAIANTVINFMQMHYGLELPIGTSISDTSTDGDITTAPDSTSTIVSGTTISDRNMTLDYRTANNGNTISVIDDATTFVDSTKTAHTIIITDYVSTEQHDGTADSESSGAPGKAPFVLHTVYFLIIFNILLSRFVK